MIWQFNVYAIPLYALAIPLLLLVAYAWRFRDQLTVRLFIATLSLALLLILSYATELMVATLPGIKFLIVIEYFAQSVLVMLLLFSLSYAGYAHWVGPRLVLLLYAPVAIVVLLVATNDHHGLIWSYTGLAEYNGVVMFDRSYGPVFWLWYAYLTGLLVVASFFLLRRAILSADLYRWQAILLVIGALLPWILSAISILQLSPVPYLDLEPYGIGLMLIPVGFSLLRFRLLDLLPMAHAVVIKSIQDALIVCDQHLRVIEVNPAAHALLGESSSATLGANVADLLPGLPELAGADAINMQLELPNMHTYELRAVPLDARRGVDAGWLIILRDITARLDAEYRTLELRIERERVTLLEEIIENMSHDFRTPITVISTSNYLINRLAEKGQASNGSAEAALEQQRLFCQILQKSASIEQSTQRLSRIFDDLLDVLSLEQAPPMDLYPGSLNHVVEEQVRHYQSQSTSKNLTYVVELAPDLPPVNMEPTYMGRAIDSLLNNAFHYTPEGGTITVRTGKETAEPLVWVEVQDTGPGIMPDDMPHIFKYFYRADKARSIDTGGAGVGLPIARMIVERHGGQIIVRSTPAAGSTFRIFIPLAASQPENA